jgi:hypothetical protein
MATPGSAVGLGCSKTGPRPAVVGAQDGVQRDRQTGEVAVVDAPVIELTDELAEQPRPVAAGGCDGRWHLHAPLDEPHSRASGGGGTGLFPGSVPAGGRTPLRDRSTASRGDRPTTPGAGRRRSPSSSTINSGAGRRRASPFDLRMLSLLAPLLLPLPPSSPVGGAAALSHALDCADEAPVTRHHELRNPTVQEVCPS